MNQLAPALKIHFYNTEFHWNPKAKLNMAICRITNALENYGIQINHKHGVKLINECVLASKILDKIIKVQIILRAATKNYREFALGRY